MRNMADCLFDLHTSIHKDTEKERKEQAGNCHLVGHNACSLFREEQTEEKKIPMKKEERIDGSREILTKT